MNKLPPQRRSISSDKTIEKLEYDWWNENAETIRKVWEMHDDVSWIIRKDYIQKGKQFLLDKSDKSIKLLELGCGSGWVGQLFMGPRIHIIGTDFSENQIDLAEKNASRKEKQEYCSYFVSSSGEWRDEFNDVDGVLIHCYLHHLNEKEISETLLTIKNKLSKGVKIWIYEPAFYLSADQQLEKKQPISRFSYIQQSIFLRNFLGKLFENKNWVDKGTYEALIKLQKKATENGWYLSPKEIPFEVDEFSTKLEDYFTVANHYWATINAIGDAQQINLIVNPLFRKIMANAFLPFLVSSDRKLCKEGFLRNLLTYPTYAFHVWECIL